MGVSLSSSRENLVNPYLERTCAQGGDPISGKTRYVAEQPQAKWTLPDLILNEIMTLSSSPLSRTPLTEDDVLGVWAGLAQGWGGGHCWRTSALGAMICPIAMSLML